MNGIEKITARITAEANEAAAAVIAEAEKTAGEIRAAYQKKADEAYEARMNEGNTEVRLGAERVERAAKLQSRKDTLSDESGDFSGGLKLREGSVEVNCTVDTLLALSRNSLDAEIAAILFD